MLPIPANVTVTIHRSTGVLAATGVPGYLDGAYAEGLEKAESASAFRYTHILLVDLDVDVRDDFSEFGTFGNRDVVSLPDATGTPFTVVYVERPFRGGGQDWKRVFLNRRQPVNWPTSDL